MNEELRRYIKAPHQQFSSPPQERKRPFLNNIPKGFPEAIVRNKYGCNEIMV